MKLFSAGIAADLSGVMKDEPVLDVDVELSRERFRLTAKMRSTSPAIAIVGPSGSGKSTFLRVLAGLERKAKGRVSFGDTLWQNTKQALFVPPWQRRIGYVPQDSLLIPTLSVFENLSFAGANAVDVKSLAERLAIDPLLQRRPRMLSGGEKQRVALGRALLANPALLLLDEPFSALDRDLRTRVSDTLNTICRERDLPLILISHDESDVLSLAEEAWSFRNGFLEPFK